MRSESDAHAGEDVGSEDVERDDLEADPDSKATSKVTAKRLGMKKTVTVN